MKTPSPSTAPEWNLWSRQHAYRVLLHSSGFTFANVPFPPTLRPPGGVCPFPNPSDFSKRNGDTLPALYGFASFPQQPLGVLTTLRLSLQQQSATQRIPSRFDRFLSRLVVTRPPSNDTYPRWEKLGEASLPPHIPSQTNTRCVPACISPACNHSRRNHHLVCCSPS